MYICVCFFFMFPGILLSSRTCIRFLRFLCVFRVVEEKETAGRYGPETRNLSGLRVSFFLFYGGLSDESVIINVAKERFPREQFSREIATVIRTSGWTLLSLSLAARERRGDGIQRNKQQQKKTKMKMRAESGKIGGGGGGGAENKRTADKNKRNAENRAWKGERRRGRNVG